MGEWYHLIGNKSTFYCCCRPSTRLWRSIMEVWLLTMRPRRHSSWEGIFTPTRLQMTLSSFGFQDLPGILGSIRRCNPTKFSLFAPLSLHFKHTTIFWERRCDLFLFLGIWKCIRPIFQKENVFIRNHSKLFGKILWPSINRVLILQILQNVYLYE